MHLEEVRSMGSLNRVMLLPLYSPAIAVDGSDLIS